MKSAITISLVPEARGGPFVFWDNLPEACQKAGAMGFDAIEIAEGVPQSLDHELSRYRQIERATRGGI